MPTSSYIALCVSVCACVSLCACMSHMVKRERGDLFSLPPLMPSIFMIHMRNFRRQTGLCSSSDVFTIGPCSLQLMADRPLNMATRYFTIFPDDCECDGRSGGCGVVMGRRGGVV